MITMIHIAIHIVRNENHIAQLIGGCKAIP